MLHVDVMDGHFVPNLSIGQPVVRSLRAFTDLVIDCHLMIEDPDRYSHEFVAAGADMVSVHQEACRHLNRSLQHIVDHGARAGVVINPATPVHSLDEVLEMVDYVLVMSVNPGFGGQKFLPSSLDKMRRLKQIREEPAAGLPDRNRRRYHAAECGRGGAGRSRYCRCRQQRLRRARSRRSFPCDAPCDRGVATVAGLKPANDPESFVRG